MSLRLLLLSPEPALARSLAAQLELAGFSCSLELDAASFDVVLLDGAAIIDPGLGPVLRLLNPGEADEGEGCLTKPVRLAQLVTGLIRLAERGRNSRMIAIGAWTLDVGGSQLVRGGDCQKLTGKEAEILTYLSERANPVGRDELLNAIWGYGEGISTHTLETHIYRLRQKLEEDPAVPAYLLTIDGGYLLKKDSS